MHMISSQMPTKQTNTEQCCVPLKVADAFLSTQLLHQGQRGISLES